MAEDGINPLITPEKNESGSMKMDSNSAGNPRSPSNEFGQLADSRRKSYSSNEKTDQANATKHRVPIYLRASTGSCHDICKYGKHHAFEEKPRESVRKRILKSSPIEANSINIIVSDSNQKEVKLSKEKAFEPLRTRTSKISPNEVKSVKLSFSSEKNKEKAEPSSDYTKKHSLSIKNSPRTKSCSPKLLCSSPRRSDLSRNKTGLPNLPAPRKSMSISEVPEIIKREILLLPSEIEGSSNDGKISGADKKTCDQSCAIKSKSIKVKPVNASGDSYGFRTGRKMTSSTLSADKALETPYVARSSTTRSSLGKMESSKAREAGRVKESFSSSSPQKYRDGTGKSKGGVSEKTLHVIKTETEKNNVLNSKAMKAGRVKSSSSPQDSRQGAGKSDGSEKALHVIKTETQNHASSSSSSSINLSREKENENEEIKDGGNDSDESVSEKTVSVEIGNIQSSLSHEDDDEKIAYKIFSSEIENLQPLDVKNQDTILSLSSHDDDDDEQIYPSSSSSSSSSSESSSHAKSSSLSSLEEINGEHDDEFISGKTVSMEIGKVHSAKENRKILKKCKSIVSDDKNRSPVKLKFRRGTIIDLQPENNVPKRLRFRRARIVGNKTDDFAPGSKKSMETLRRANSLISENKRSVDSKPGTPNKHLRKSRSVASEDKNRSPVNLSRRVDLQTANRSPTRLKFTRASRVLRSEDGKSDLRKKATKKTGSKNDAVGFELSCRRVVLKHPEVQRKKNGQVLLNNVIEETASKLVETRKSKVKALVGAFETVISLQESKPSSR